MEQQRRPLALAGIIVGHGHDAAVVHDRALIRDDTHLDVAGNLACRRSSGQRHRQLGPRCAEPFSQRSALDVLVLGASNEDDEAAGSSPKKWRARATTAAPSTVGSLRSATRRYALGPLPSRTPPSSAIRPPDQRTISRHSSCSLRAEARAGSTFARMILRSLGEKRLDSETMSRWPSFPTTSSRHSRSSRTASGSSRSVRAQRGRPRGVVVVDRAHPGNAGLCRRSLAAPDDPGREPRGPRAPRPRLRGTVPASPTRSSTRQTAA